MSSSAIGELRKELGRTYPSVNFERGGGTNLGLWLEQADPELTSDDEHRDVVEKIRDSIDRKKEELNDADDLVSFKIQYHWGNYSNYTQTASTIEKREDEHTKGIIQNI